uniref:Uncharacterized protein n=1 Tax=Arundo donax TaxID=35708 RepID=A0A0A9AAG9_ARUDO
MAYIGAQREYIFICLIVSSLEHVSRLFARHYQTSMHCKTCFNVF